MRAVVRLSLVFVLATLVTSVARADRIVLRNGSNLSGKITRETADEVDLTLEDGMRMTLRRSRIRSIERESESKPARPGTSPLRTPLRPPAEEPEDQPEPEVAVPAAIPLPDGPYDSSPLIAWNGDFARHPVIMVSKVTPFRAYRLVRRSPLAVDPGDRQYADLLRRHGHGGSLSMWEFEYEGMRELRFGDQVRFIAELTTPTDEQNQLIRLKAGPAAVTPRLAVFLVKRRGRIERYATTTIFAPADFRQEELKRLSEYQVNVRTYQDDYVPIASTWLEPSKSAFLSGMSSPVGNSIRMKILNCRFRLTWFETPPEDRPALDPDLITRGNLRPLAKPGRPVADAKLIRRAWGTARSTRVEHNDLVDELRAALSVLSIKPDRNYIVECDLIGVLGTKGVSIETRRYFLAQETMEDLLTHR